MGVLFGAVAASSEPFGVGEVGGGGEGGGGGGEEDLSRDRGTGGGLARKSSFVGIFGAVDDGDEEDDYLTVELKKREV